MAASSSEGATEKSPHAQQSAGSTDYVGSPGGWMFERLTQTRVFGKQITSTDVFKDVERIGGVINIYQAPSLSTATVAGERPLLLRLVPTTMRRPKCSVNVGDRCPDFSIVASDGSTVTLADLKGTAFVMRLTRTIGSGIICPACLPGMDDLMHMQEQFAQIGVRVLVVVTSPPRQAQEMERILGLTYPLYSDKDYDVFETFDTRFCSGPPLPAWVIVDDQGIVRHLWRVQSSSNMDGMKPHPRGAEILAEAKRCLSK